MRRVDGVTEPSSRRDPYSRSVPNREDASDDLWETHADWWIEGFTDGADPEYEEQILPLAAAELAGAGRVLDVGCGDGQISRLVRRNGAELVVGIDPTWNQLSVAARARRRAVVRPRGRRRAAVRRRHGSTPSSPASCSSTSATSTTRSPRSPACCVPGGRFCFFLNHPLLQTPNSGWIDDQVLDPPEQYWRIGPYLVEDETIEEVEKDVFIPFIHRPLSRYVNALAGNGLFLERMDEPAPPAGFLARAAEYEAAATIPRLLYLRCVKRA